MLLLFAVFFFHDTADTAFYTLSLHDALPIFLVSTNGFVNFTPPSSLTVAGELEVQSGGRLRVDGNNPPRDITLSAGVNIAGTGTILFEGSNRLVLAGNSSVSGVLDFVSSSSISGSGVLTIAAGATLRFDHSSTIPGSVIVNGTLTLTSSSITLTIGGTLTLNAGGVLNNPGAIRVGTFVNNGGTINGNVPSPPPPPPLLHIEKAQL